MGVFLVFLTCAERERETERQRETEKQRETETERQRQREWRLVKLFLNESENVVAKEQSEIELDF